MKLLSKILVILIALQFSTNCFAKENALDTLQSNNLKQGTNRQAALFQATNLFFQSGSANLDSGALSVLDKMVAETKNPSSISFTISGFADPTGSSEMNLKLSERRVESVKNELINRGFSDPQLSIKVIGESQSTNISPTDYAKMRKVEIKPIVLFK